MIFPFKIHEQVRFYRFLFLWGCFMSHVLLILRNHDNSIVWGPCWRSRKISWYRRKRRRMFYIHLHPPKRSNKTLPGCCRWYLVGGFNHSQWEGWNPIYEMENKIHVWNHQPDIYRIGLPVLSTCQLDYVLVVVAFWVVSKHPKDMWNIGSISPNMWNKNKNQLKCLKPPTGSINDYICLHRFRGRSSAVQQFTPRKTRFRQRAWRWEALRVSQSCWKAGFCWLMAWKASGNSWGVQQKPRVHRFKNDGLKEQNLGFNVVLRMLGVLQWPINHGFGAHIWILN